MSVGEEGKKSRLLTPQEQDNLKERQTSDFANGRSFYLAAVKHNNKFSKFKEEYLVQRMTAVRHAYVRTITHDEMHITVHKKIFL